MLFMPWFVLPYTCSYFALSNIVIYDPFTFQNVYLGTKPHATFMAQFTVNHFLDLGIVLETCCKPLFVRTFALHLKK